MTTAQAQSSVKSDPCWVCGSTQKTLWKKRGVDRALIPEDMAITDSRYGVTLSLYKCDNCGFVYAQGDELAELVSLYERLTDTGYEGTQDTRLLQMKMILDIARRHHPEAKTLLDIGAGAGLLVSEAKRRGYDAQGIEPSHSLVEAAEKINGVKLHQGIFPHKKLEGQKFDVITLVDVIEHVGDPVSLLRACGEHLAPGGIFIVITPDISSLAARLLGRRWWHLRLAHVGYFSRSTLNLALEKAGLTPVEWRRAKWYFRSGYLADRVGAYLPVNWFNRFVRNAVPKMMEVVVPLNLFDSWLCVIKSSK